MSPKGLYSTPKRCTLYSYQLILSYPMNKEECETNGGTWNEEGMMCTHPEGAESAEAMPAEEGAETESM